MSCSQIEKYCTREDTIITHPKNCRIIRHLRRFRRLVLLGRLLDTKILHITPPKDNVLIDIVGCRYLVAGAASTAFGAMRADLFKRDCGILRADLVKGANIAATGLVEVRDHHGK